MTKVIILSIQSQHAVNILKGFKTEELRKSVPKGFRGWVYIYVTLKRPVLINKNYISEFYEVLDTAVKEYKKSAYQDEVLNGKVVARFWFDEYETYYYNEHQDNYRLLMPIKYYPVNPTLPYKKLCLTESEANAYGKGKDLYTWKIKDLQVLDEPMELSDFYRRIDGLDENGDYILTDEIVTIPQLKEQYTVKKAPQSWQYIYVKGESK